METILIHTMGKVGSSSIRDSLVDIFPKVNIYQTHFLNPNRLHDRIEKLKKSQSKISFHLKQSQKFREKYIDNGIEREKFKVITLVRDPVARNISGFFQNIESFFPGFIDRYESGNLSDQEIIKSFYKNYPHQLPLEWIKKEIEEVFNVEIYSNDFSKSKGWMIIQEPISLLVIRLEDLNKQCRCIFKNFLGISEFELKKSNEANRKEYQKAYDKFKSSINLPKSYLDRMYTSEYARYFYTEEELKAFYLNWKNN